MFVCTWLLAVIQKRQEAGGYGRLDTVIHICGLMTRNTGTTLGVEVCLQPNQFITTPSGHVPIFENISHQLFF